MARTLGRFVLGDEIARGGMGIVHAATDSLSGARVAVKVLPDADRTPEAMARFERESLALAALDHPSIVRYLAHGRTDGGELFLAMQWLEGEDLGRRLERGRISVPESVALARTIAGALGAVHARGLVHRDLKPSNIVLVAGDLARPVLLDFGIARNAAVTAMTRTGGVLGTPQYMAPEQVRGSRDLDARVDLFALGLVLYECVTGSRAFLGDQAMAVLAKILLEEPAPIGSFGVNVPPSVEALVRRLLEKDPNARPASASEVGALLDVCATQLSSGWDSPGSAASGGLTTGERRLVAVALVTERASTTAIAETITPDAAVTNAEQLRAAVRPHAGELSALGAHRFLVAFPSGGEATDLAGRAARCALSIAGAWPTADVALAVGWAQHQRSGPVGEVIDRAAALLDVPTAVRVRADEATASLLEVRFAIAAHAGVLEILGERQAEEPPRTLLGKPTRFVGRDRELGILWATLDEVIEDGVARAVVVTAPSGTGKSRLRHEFLDRVRRGDTPVSVLTARAEILRAGSPLELCAGLVRAWAAIDGPDPEAARHALTTKVSQRIAEAQRTDVAEFLGEIVGAAFPSESSPRLAAARVDARLAAEHMVGAFLAMLRAECAAHPVLLVLEDLHWGDPQTVRFVDAALRELADVPLFVLALARPEVHERFPGLWKARGQAEIALGTLSSRACEKLASEVLGNATPEILARIVEHAAGNALYLEELIRAAAEGELSTLPVSVLAMLQARLEALDPMARRVLRAASVLGESFDRLAIEALLGNDRASVDTALVGLDGAEVMVRRGPSGYAFRHAAVREAAYAMLTDEDRTLGHGLAAKWLEQAGEIDAHLIAEHYDRAANTADAARWFARAARQAVERSDFEGALARAQRAITLGAAGEDLGEARFARGNALFCLARLVEASDEYDLALPCFEGNDQRRLDTLREIWSVGVYRQSSPIIRRAGEEALRMAHAESRPVLAAEARCALAIADHCDERCDAGLALFRAAVSAAGERPSFVFGVSSILLYHVGQYAEAEAMSSRMLVHSRDLRDHSTSVVLLANLGVVQAGLGRYEEARANFAEARSLGERLGLLMVTARAASIAAGHFFDVLDLEAAEAAASESCRIGRELEFVTPLVSSTLDLAFLRVRRGDPARAEEIADSVAKQVASGTGFHGWLWRSRMLVLRAEIALTRDPLEALALADRAIDVCKRVRREKYVLAGEVLRARALALAQRRDEACDRLSVLLEGEPFPDPAVRLRLSTALLALREDPRAREVATAAATLIEAGLPASARPAFRGSVAPLLAPTRA